MFFRSKKSEVAETTGSAPPAMGEVPAPLKSLEMVTPPGATTANSKAEAMRAALPDRPVALARQVQPAEAPPRQPMAQKPTGASIVSVDERRRNMLAADANAAAFGHIVNLMMREARFRAMPLAELERAVMPALAARQFSLATASAVPRPPDSAADKAPSNSNGVTAPDAQRASEGAKEIKPVAAVLWAQVSEVVDQRLSDVSQKTIRLEPQDWTSGDIVWIVDAMGDRRVISALIKQCHGQQWAERLVKMRVRGRSGKMEVRELGA